MYRFGDSQKLKLPKPEMRQIPVGGDHVADPVKAEQAEQAENGWKVDPTGLAAQGAAQQTPSGVKLVSPLAAGSAEDVPDLGFRPRGEWVVIEPITQSEVTASGIAFPEIANRKSNEGRVRALGTGRREFDPAKAETPEGGWTYLPIDLKINDRVLYVRWSGHMIDVDGKQYFLVEDSNIVAVATNETSVLAFWQDRH